MEVLRGADYYDQKMLDLNIGSETFFELAKKEVIGIQKILNLTTDQKILDVACGTGRHAYHLACQGFEVTGIDANRLCIQLAQKLCKGKKVHLACADMRGLEEFKGKFNIVLNLFTSFGHFSNDEDNIRSLIQMRNCLRPGGKLVIHTVDRSWFLRNLNPEHKYFSNNIEVMEWKNFCDQTSYLHFKSKLSTLKEQSFYQLHLKLYHPKELAKLFLGVGLKQVRIYGDFKGSEYIKGVSTHPIVVGQL